MSAQPPRRSPARLLAPLALVACALALLFVVGAALGGGDSDSDGSGAETPEQATTEATESTEAPAPPRRRTYTVKAGDNLDLIAEKTEVPVDTLQELNPEVDPQALVIGQKITLRE